MSLNNPVDPEKQKINEQIKQKIMIPGAKKQDYIHENDSESSSQGSDKEKIISAAEMSQSMLNNQETDSPEVSQGVASFYEDKNT